MKTQLNAREKFLANAVLLVSVLMIGKWAHQQMASRLGGISGQLRLTEEQTRQSQELLSQTASAPRTEEAKRLTSVLLKDLSLPQESDQIRVISVDKSGEKSFQITVEGEFPEVMRFFSYLERAEGRFSVSRAELSRLEPSFTSDTAAVKHEIRGIFQLQVRVG